MLGVDHRAQPFEAFYQKYRGVQDKHNALQQRKNQVNKSKGPTIIGGGPDGQQASGHGPSAGEISSQLGTLTYEFAAYEKIRETLDQGATDKNVQQSWEFKKTIEATSTTVFSHEESYGRAQLGGGTKGILFSTPKNIRRPHFSTKLC